MSYPERPKRMAEIGHKDTIVALTSSYSGDEGHIPEIIPQGWPHLAHLMASTPEFAAFSRFRDLNIKSLLYYQCELNVLREKLNYKENVDLNNGNDYNVNAEKLITADPVPEQYKMILDIRALLKEYSESCHSCTAVVCASLTTSQTQLYCSSLKSVHCQTPSRPTCAL